MWSMLAEGVGQLDEPFRRGEIIGWFRRHHPEVNEATLGAHIQAATVNATNRGRNNALGARAPLLRRIDHSLYVRAASAAAPAVPAPATAPSVPVVPGPMANVVLTSLVSTTVRAQLGEVRGSRQHRAGGWRSPIAGWLLHADAESVLQLVKGG